MPELLKASELAEVLGVPRGTIYKWVKLGMPVIHAPELSPRYELDRVKEWLRQFETRAGQVKPDPPAPPPKITPDKRMDYGWKDVIEAPDPPDELPRGVYLGKGERVYGIDYQISDGKGGSKRKRESAGVLDPYRAAVIRAERLIAAWKDEPQSVRRDKHLQDAARTLKEYGE